MISPQPDPMIGIGMSMAVLVAAIFVIAAVVKATALSTTTSDLAALGVPSPAIVARVLPPFELAIASLLLTIPKVGAIAAIGSLVAFTAILVRAVRSGADVSCGCLGPLSRAPVSYSTVARNGVLLAMTATVLAVPQPVVPDLGSALTAASLVLMVVIGVQLLALRAQIGRMWSVALAGEQGSSPRRRGGK